MANNLKNKRVVSENTKLLRLKTRITNEFIKHIEANSTLNLVDYGNWYCGITKHPQKRILQHMKKRQTLALYPIIRNARAKENANEIEKIMTDNGTINAPHSGGAKDDSIYVYLFKDTATPLDILNSIFDFLNS